MQACPGKSPWGLEGPGREFPRSAGTFHGPGCALFLPVFDQLLTLRLSFETRHPTLEGGSRPAWTRRAYAWAAFAHAENVSTRDSGRPSAIAAETLTVQASLETYAMSKISINQPGDCGTQSPSAGVCVHHLLERRARNTPDVPAVEAAGCRLTYRELNAAANRFARVLLRQGIQPGSRVGISLPRSIDGIVAIYGLLKAGAVLVPMDPSYPKDRLDFMETAAGLSARIQSRGTKTSDGPGPSIPVLDIASLVDDARHECDSDLQSNLTPDSLLYIIFTSGSTGKPKGVAMPHGPLVNLAQWQAESLDHVLPSPARTLQFTTLSFDVAYQEIICTACEGGTLVLMDEELRYDPSRLWRFLCEAQIHRLFLPFVALHQLAESADLQDAGRCALRQVITAGEQLQSTPRIRALFRSLKQARLHNHYGPSETHVATAFSLPADPDTWQALPSIGYPVANTAIHLLDDAGKEVAEGESGELYISGACLAQGYFDQTELTRERFVDLVLPGQIPTRAYRTGDLARRAPDGSLEFLGRKDLQVKIRGHRVELGEIETALGSHPAVRDCVVSAFGEGPERQLAAYVVSGNSETPSPAELRRHLGSTLADYLIPIAYVFLPSLPLTPSGKVDRRALPAPQNHAPPRAVLPLPQLGGNVEQRIARIWSDLLQIDAADPDASFFDLGGHSLLLARVQKALEQDFARPISILDLFRHATIRSLSAFLSTPPESSVAGTRETPFINRGPISGHEPVAIVGISGRWPGAANVRELWAALDEGRELTTEFTREELLSMGASPDQMEEEGYVRRRGFLPGVEYFDAAFFSFTPKDAEITDPQQRLFLECAWEALEDAGLDPARERRRIGVYAGSSLNTYFLHYVLPTRANVEQFTQAFQVDHYPLLIGNDKDYLASRVAYKLSLKGPALTIQTACSTSLVAVTQACSALLAGQCEAALAGGVSISFPQQRGYVYQEGAIASADGRCRAFDASASGTVFGAGAGVVVLKRLTTALTDGDHIYAVIRGCGLNNDGGDKVSFSAPSIQGQAEVITSALEQAGVSADTIGYVEAHGTGTPLGDPIEVAALTQAFRRTTQRREFCILGSVKTNLGHLESAAGVTGLIKAALALHHERLPGTLHFKEPNPKCALHESPFRVSSTALPWPRNDQPRRAGVSAFGVGGTNAHVILEEAPATRQNARPRPAELILLSSKTATGLQSTTERWHDHLAALGVNHADTASFANAAHTTRVGRRAFEHRRIVVASSAIAAAEALKALDPRSVFHKHGSGPAKSAVFMFPGQGAQYPGMGRQLYATEDIFRRAMDQCCEFLRPRLGLDLRDLLNPKPDTDKAAAESLRNTSLAQPALFCLEYSLACLWRSWGVEPSALIGHSIGEYVAAVVAGVMDLETALTLVAARGALMHSLPAGAMLSVRLADSEVERFLTPGLSVAAINSPRSCVVSGPFEDVERLERALADEGIACKRLHTSHAFHSAMMDPMLDGFAKELQRVTLRPAKLPVISTRTGSWITPDAWTQPEYWVQQVRECVRFSQAIATASQMPGVALLEVGPGQTLTTLSVQTLGRDSRHVALPSMPPVENPEESQAILTALGRLWLEGVAADWDRFDEGRGLARASAPTYPFEKQRYWAESSLRGDILPAKGIAVPEDSSKPQSDAPVQSALEATIQQQLRVMQLQLHALTEAAQEAPDQSTVQADLRLSS